MFSLLEEIRLNHASAVKANPTVARYLALDADGTVAGIDFAWPDPTDRNGDGEAEAEAFLEVSVGNGFHVSDITNWGEIGPGIPGDIPSDSIRVYMAQEKDIFNSGDVQFFALAVVPADGYWDRETEQWITVGA
jgi:hypothetical protein